MMSPKRPLCRLSLSSRRRGITVLAVSNSSQTITLSVKGSRGSLMRTFSLKDLRKKTFWRYLLKKKVRFRMSHDILLKVWVLILTSLPQLSLMPLQKSLRNNLNQRKITSEERKKSKETLQWPVSLTRIWVISSQVRWQKRCQFADLQRRLKVLS